MSIGSKYKYDILEQLRIGSSSVKMGFRAFINGWTQVKDRK